MEGWPGLHSGSCKHVPGSLVELLGAYFPSVRCGKFHMALAWDRARPCLGGQKEGAVHIPPGRQPPPPMHKSCLVDISIRLIIGSGRLWETPSGWRSPASTRVAGMAVSTGPGRCQSLTQGKLNPGSDMSTGEGQGSRGFLPLRGIHTALAGVLEAEGPWLPAPQHWTQRRMSATLAAGGEKRPRNE